jgi:hypothetical protein
MICKSIRMNLLGIYLINKKRVSVQVEIFFKKQISQLHLIAYILTNLKTRWIEFFPINFHDWILTSKC